MAIVQKLISEKIIYLKTQISCWRANWVPTTSLDNNKLLLCSQDGKLKSPWVAYNEKTSKYYWSCTWSIPSITWVVSCSSKKAVAELNKILNHNSLYLPEILNNFEIILLNLLYLFLILIL